MATALATNLKLRVAQTKRLVIMTLQPPMKTAHAPFWTVAVFAAVMESLKAHVIATVRCPPTVTIAMAFV